MKEKLFASIICIVLAGVCLIQASNSKTIICSKKDNVCYTRTDNSIFKTSNFSKRVKIRKYSSDTKYGSKVSVGIGGEDLDASISYKKRTADSFVCYKKTSTVKTENGTKRRTNYFLVPKRETIRHHVTRSNALGEYNSSASCEIDRQIIEEYLISDNMENLEHRVVSSHFNFLWYIGVGVFLLFGVLILFGKQVSEAEMRQMPTISEEQKQEVYDKIMGFANFASKFDSDAAKKINNFAEQIKRVDIDIDRKD